MTIATKELPLFLPQNPKSPLDFYVQAREQGEVVKISVGTFETYVLSNPEHIREVVVSKQDHFIKGFGLRELKVLVGEGILTSEKAQHRQDRQVMQPFFNMQYIGTYADKMVEFTKQELAAWQNGEVRDTTNDMMEITMNVITETMFGTSVQEDVDDVRHAMHSVLFNFTEKLRQLGDQSEEAKKQRDLELMQGVQTLDRVIYKIIQDRHEHPQEGRRDLLSILMSNARMTDQELRDQVMTIFLAGHETTANTLAWTFYLLAQHPEVEQKLLTELEAVLGGRAATYEDYTKLTYTNHVIQESMRLYPAAWIIGREVDQDVVIGDYQFEKGMQVSMSQWAVHRDAKWYDDPDTFRPERFEGDLLKQLPAYAYFPFGGGPRICIGNNFALLEACMVLATILQHYKLVLVEGEKVVPEPLVTLRPANLKMKVVKR